MTDNASQGRAVAVDHVGYVVKDIDAAVAFFVDELGFENLNRSAVLRDDEGDLMTKRFDLNPRAVGRHEFVGIGPDKIEFLEWVAPNRNLIPPRNSDLGGRHLAIKIDDVEAAAARISKLRGFTVREPNDRGYRYVTTPFGLELQLIP